MAWNIPGLSGRLVIVWMVLTAQLNAYGEHISYWVISLMYACIYRTFCLWTENFLLKISHGNFPCISLWFEYKPPWCIIGVSIMLETRLLWIGFVFYVGGFEWVQNEVLSTYGKSALSLAAACDGNWYSIAYDHFNALPGSIPMDWMAEKKLLQNLLLY